MLYDACFARVQKHNEQECDFFTNDLNSNKWIACTICWFQASHMPLKIQYYRWWSSKRPLEKDDYETDGLESGRINIPWEESPVISGASKGYWNRRGGKVAVYSSLSIDTGLLNSPNQNDRPHLSTCTKWGLMVIIYKSKYISSRGEPTVLWYSMNANLSF